MTAMSRCAKGVAAARAMPSRRERTMWPASSAANSTTGPVQQAGKCRRAGTPEATLTARSRVSAPWPISGSSVFANPASVIALNSASGIVRMDFPWSRKPMRERSLISFSHVS